MWPASLCAYCMRDGATALRRELEAACWPRDSILIGVVPVVVCGRATTVDAPSCRLFAAPAALESALLPLFAHASYRTVQYKCVLPPPDFSGLLPAYSCHGCAARFYDGYAIRDPII